MKTIDDLLVLLGIRRDKVAAVETRLDENAELLVAAERTITQLNQKIDHLEAENAALRSKVEKPG
jgi:chromosome segregation ATPase